MENASVRELIYENVRALCKANGEKMSYVETKVLGVSPGYLSRTHKGLKFEHIYTMAKHFNVSIDDLTESNYMELYKAMFAKAELIEAVNRAKEVMKDCDILETVSACLRIRYIQKAVEKNEPHEVKQK